MALTPSERLALLEPVANHDDLSLPQLRRAVFQFLNGFESLGLRLPTGQRELWDVTHASESELRAVARKVTRVFETGFLFEHPGKGAEHITVDDIPLPLSFPSLRFGAFVPRKGSRDRRFMLMVEGGRLRDLVPYLAMHLLATAQHGVQRCEAPAPWNWQEQCGRLFVRAEGRGRPRKYCSDACLVRTKNRNVQRKNEEEDAEALRAAGGSPKPKVKRKGDGPPTLRIVDVSEHVVQDEPRPNARQRRRK